MSLKFYKLKLFYQKNFFLFWKIIDIKKRIKSVWVLGSIAEVILLNF